MHTENDALLDRYVHWLETLSAQGTHRISQFVGNDVRCRNPESETSGIQGADEWFKQILTGRQVTTKILDRAAGQDGHTFYLRWDRLSVWPNGVRETLSGMSEIMVGLDGKIVSIIDYWDSVPLGQQPSVFARLFKR